MSDFSVAQYEELIAKIHHTIEEVTRDFNNGMRRAENDSSSIPLVGNYIRDLIKKAQNLFDEAMAELNKFLEVSDVPPQLWKFGNSWNSIATEVSDCAIQLHRVQQYSGGWKGIAGGKYKNAVSGQEPAADVIKTRADSISNACDSMANNGFNAYMAMGVALVGLVGAFISTGTGPGAIVGYAVGLTAFLAALAYATHTLTIGLGTNIRSLEQVNQPSDVFTGESWPQSWPSATS
ncbi:MAG: hypothetical protein J2P25_12940 [Nocardiopsaceae bacterium]|nr:hypothetical protein [Nocardiopsaceae bacterium]